MRLVFHQSGEPTSVLQLESFKPRPPQQGEVQVRMLYAPINPADLNYIEGTYGKLPSFPAVPGNEGCGRVEAVGPGVDALAVDDLVIPTKALGVWSTIVVAAADQWFKLPSDIDPIQASMLRVNPVTAWQMLHSFRNLKKGDFIIQNAANSGVGRSVIQIAQNLGLRTINFVRRMDLKEKLSDLVRKIHSKESKSFSAIYFDLDNFKKVNDKYGHREGDKVLRTIGKVIRYHIREVDVFARVGGDEFVLIMPDITDSIILKRIYVIRKLLLQAMKRRKWPVTFSIGLVKFHKIPQNVMEILKIADETMYLAKKSGKNRIVTKTH